MNVKPVKSHSEPNVSNSTPKYLLQSMVSSLSHHQDDEDTRVLKCWLNAKCLFFTADHP